MSSTLGLKGKTFIFDTNSKNKASFWMFLSGYPERLNFFNKIVVTFHSEAESFNSIIKCEVTDPTGKEIVAFSNGCKKNLGKKISGFLSSRDLMFLKLLNNPTIETIT